MTSAIPPDRELNRLARTHLQYEVGVVVAQACEFHSRYPKGMPTKNEFKDPDTDDALLEAVLVHLCLLDDFLKSQRFPNDVKANCWVDQSLWKPKAWLHPAIRTKGTIPSCCH